MKEEVYNYLKEYGFTKEELSSFEEINEKMFFTNLNEVNKNIDFLMNKGLNKEEVMHVFRHNPYMITVKNNRLAELDKIYLEELLLSQEELRKLIKDNPETYTESPIELQRIIDKLKELNCSLKTIKEIFLENPKILDMTINEFDNIVKFIKGDYYE